MATEKKFVQTIPLFLQKFVWLVARDNPTKFQKDLLSSCWENLNLSFEIFFLNFPFPWQQEPFLKNQTLGAKLDIGIQLPVKYQEGLTNGCGELERTKF